MFNQIPYKHWPVRFTEVLHDFGSRNAITQISVAGIHGLRARSLSVILPHCYPALGLVRLYERTLRTWPLLTFISAVVYHTSFVNPRERTRLPKPGNGLLICDPAPGATAQIITHRAFKSQDFCEDIADLGEGSEQHVHSPRICSFAVLSPEDRPHISIKTGGAG